ncbi:hypothetical protein ACHAXM_000892 [Skeletonema potamos]
MEMTTSATNSSCGTTFLTCGLMMIQRYLPQQQLIASIFVM